MSFIDNTNGSGGSGGNTTATYVTQGDESSSLTNSRRLAAGTNVTLVDGGAGGNLTINASGGGGGSGADPGAAYIVVSNTSSLGNERALVGGTGILLTDGGANTGITASINNGVVATISGSRFTGLVSVDPSQVQSVGTDVQFYVSGTVDLTSGQPGRKVALFGGRLHASGNVASEKAVVGVLGLSGSLTKLSDGTTSAFVGGTGILISSSSNGSVIVSPNNNVLATISGSRFTGVITVDPSQAVSVGTDAVMFVSSSQFVAQGNANRKVPVVGGDLYVSGAVYSAVSGNLLSAAGNYQLTFADQIVFVSASLVGITASLPSPALRTMHTFVDTVGSGSTFTLLVKRNGSERIDTVAADKTVQSNFFRTTIVSDGTNWHSLGTT